MYYIGGASDVKWRTREHETIGLTHPFFRDGRARGFGIAAGAGGTGHDKMGWEFWNQVRGAYGTVVIGGKRFRHPQPTSMVWRPDRVICTYDVGGARITEVKFISRQDVVCTLITADRALTIEFEGQSFVNTHRYPTLDGDPPGRTFSQARTARGRFDAASNAIHVTEGGTILTKLDWKTPAVVGKLMYDGISVVVSSTAPLAKSQRIVRDREGRQVYSFSIALAPGRPVAVTYAMGDDYADVAKRTRQVLADPAAALAAKTRWFNGLLNTQIPRFDCSDRSAVKTYYYLWSLYFMYFTYTGKGYEAYPHTQTAVNNFMGLHLWDSWVYTAMGSWVVDKAAWGYGNVLSWKFMVPFKNKANALPDNFGTTWYSPGVWMNLVGNVELAWEMYLKSGDRAFLETVYGELFRPLYWTGGPQRSRGIELNALDCLARMARELGRTADVPHWQGMRPRLLDAFRSNWSKYAPDYYAAKGVPWKDISHLASMMCHDMPTPWADAMCDRWVMNTETGFLGAVALRIRPPNYPPNGVFAVSTISTWLAVEGMFRHHRDADAVFCTLNHIRAMNKDHGHPVAPECWDPHDKPWGSQYYNWDGCMTDLLLKRLAGVSYSVRDGTFTVCDHLPERWSFIEVAVPVVQGGKTEWVTVRIDQRLSGDAVQASGADGPQVRSGSSEGQDDSRTPVRRPPIIKMIAVRNCPLKTLFIEPWLADRALLDESAKALGGAPRGHRRYVFSAMRDGKVTVRLGKTTVARKTLAVVTPAARAFVSRIEVRARNLEPGCRLRYTTDGSDPDASSRPADGAIVLDRSAVLKLRGFGPDGTPRTVMSVPFTKAKLLPAVLPGKVENGLAYSRFEGTWKRIPDMKGLTPTKTGVTQDLNVAALGGRKDRFALEFTGYVKVPVDGLYRFAVKSDDGSRLWIDGRKVVELDVLCALDPWEAGGEVALARGLHEITIEYFQAANRARLELSYSIDGGPRKPVDAKMLFHAGDAGKENTK